MSWIWLVWYVGTAVILYIPIWVAREEKGPPFSIPQELVMVALWPLVVAMDAKPIVCGFTRGLWNGLSKRLQTRGGR
jgi:hypothetical protein